VNLKKYRPRRHTCIQKFENHKKAIKNWQTPAILQIWFHWLTDWVSERHSPLYLKPARKTIQYLACSFASYSCLCCSTFIRAHRKHGLSFGYRTFESLLQELTANDTAGYYYTSCCYNTAGNMSKSFLSVQFRPATVDKIVTSFLDRSSKFETQLPFNILKKRFLGTSLNGRDQGDQICNTTLP